MGYRLLADLVVAFHLGFVLLVVLGGLLTLWQRALAWLHLPALAWGTWIELSGGVCPLTPLELRLRSAAGEQGYGGDFVAHYLLPLLYPAGLTRAAQVGLGVGVLLLNLVLYGWLWRRWARNRET